MKKFLLGFLVGTVIMYLASKAWFLLPMSLGGMGAFSLEPSPFEECKNLANKAKDFGNLEIRVLSGGKPAPKDLEIDVGPNLENYSEDDQSNKPIKYICSKKTDEKGVVVFENLPIGEVNIFFNFEFFPKELGNPGTLVHIEIKKGQTSKTEVELNPGKI